MRRTRRKLTKEREQRRFTIENTIKLAVGKGPGGSVRTMAFADSRYSWFFTWGGRAEAGGGGVEKECRQHKVERVLYLAR